MVTLENIPRYNQCLNSRRLLDTNGSLCENDEIVRYKACLITQGFLKSPGIDFGETYSPMVNVIGNHKIYAKIKIKKIKIFYNFHQGSMQKKYK